MKTDRLKLLLTRFRLYRLVRWLYKRLWLKESSTLYQLNSALDPFVQLESRNSPYPAFRGYFDRLDYSQGVLSISGWLFVVGLVEDEFRVELNRVPIGTLEPLERAGLEQHFGLREARRSGFRVEAPVPEQTMTDWVDIDIIGLLRGREVARLSTTYRPDYRDSWAEPPASLMGRTIATDQTNFYWLIGLQSFSEYHKNIQRHCDIKAAKRLLDWGCGCGRMTRFFSKHIGHLEVHGCDIDREQIEWCGANLPKARFAVIPPFPPTMYADDMFDIVTSWSVLTHLRPDVQLDWLKEMRRIIAPGGLFLASVVGESLLKFTSLEAQLEMMKTGISDSSRDRALDGIAPEGYYRSTLQRKSYTCRECSRYFRVVDYIEQGATSSHDLVVMRKE